MPQNGRQVTGGWLRQALQRVGASRLLSGAVLGATLLMPGSLSHEPASPDGQPASSPATAGARTFVGTPAVGALFTLTSSGGLGRHFCTGSVVHAAAGNLVITAAHCLGDGSGIPRIAFVPGSHDGQAPYGIWPVTAVFVNHAWSSRKAPADDIAFLRVGPDAVAGHTGQTLEQVTGAERLGTGLPHGPVRVIGYPDIAARPVSCVGVARAFRSRQLVFRCGGYTDGTSGSPFLVRASSTGRSTVMGEIGGFEKGGSTPDVSYSPRFGPQVAALYKKANA
jgi:V8-like Glu-specific endopeptidase